MTEAHNYRCRGGFQAQDVAVTNVARARLPWAQFKYSMCKTSRVVNRVQCCSKTKIHTKNGQVSKVISQRTSS